VLAIACTNRPPEPKDYAAKIAADRATKDSSFGAGDDPIPRANHAAFLPLAYFPIDPDYNVSASLKEVNDPTIIEMPTSAGGIDKFRRVGTLEFVLKGQPLKLTARAPGRSTGCSCRSPISRRAPKHTRPGAIWISTAPPPGSTTSTSTAPTFRTATTTRRTSVPIHRVKIACSCPFVLAKE
jgi:Protein of unknown function (DUF1684)